MRLSAWITVLALAVGSPFVGAQTPALFLTGYGTTIRNSTDGGMTWSTWASPSGASNLRAITVDPVTGTVFAQDRFGLGGTLTATKFAAFDTSGTLLATTTYDRTGEGSEAAAGVYNGYVYLNHGLAGGTAAQRFGYSTFVGNTFQSVPLANAQGGDWQGNDMTFASSLGTTYMFVNGSGNSGIRRWDLDTGTGLLSNPTSLTLSGTTADTDLAFTGSGRLLVINSSGLWLSAANNIGNTSITLNKVFTFTSTENSATGDMGSGAKDLVRLGNTLFAVNSTRLYSYTLDDVNGTVSFGSAALHGFNTANVQLAGYLVPEPSTFALAGLGLAGLLIFRRR
ncbi:MAG: PEP-CTERM sorting domain-containing protein [Verrucomicrobia bacterium]|jgi:hypothetical protein|nr:PEP-CTERM sorting domain-containing protein [Verrucomicrobiota bacterium]